jgi:hypothetical protein
MTQPSVLYQLIDSRLADGLPRLIEQRRPGATWQEIADEIEQITGQPVNRETLRLWFADRLEVRAFIRPDVPATTGSAA